MEMWVDFALLIAIQVGFLLFVAYKKEAFAELRPGFLAKSALIGLVFGVAFDLIFSWYLQIFGYHLGLKPEFIILNGLLSYGVMAANVLLLRNERILRFYAWAVAIGVVYELANYVFPVWYWEFTDTFLYEQAVLIFAAYFGLALMMLLSTAIVTRTRFKLFT
jgi:hypothetical protein